MDKLKINLKELHCLKTILRSNNINTVCEAARCPNINDCFNSKKATFMILGQTCTRACLFCNIKKNNLSELDLNEPYRVLKAARKLNLDHVVVTSVTRDDLNDGGASFFAKTINLLKENNFSVEVLTPDFKGDINSLELVLNEKPEVFNHNIETTYELSSYIRPEADYNRSIELLKYAKSYSNKLDKPIFIKSGFMLGLGEDEESIYKTIDDLKFIDILTIGQYFKPNKTCIDVKKYYSKEEFEKYKNYALSLAYKYVFSGAYVRSSYMAQNILKGLTV